MGWTFGRVDGVCLSGMSQSSLQSVPLVVSLACDLERALEGCAALARGQTSQLQGFPSSKEEQTLLWGVDQAARGFWEGPQTPRGKASGLRGPRQYPHFTVSFLCAILVTLLAA